MHTFFLIIVVYLLIAFLKFFPFKKAYFHVYLMGILFAVGSIVLGYAFVSLAFQILSGFFLNAGLTGKDAEYESYLLHLVRWVLQILFLLVFAWMMSIAYLVFQMCWIERDF
mmetsp:Transcript_36145/g.26837  ORF Transcript_36145/g.26837 Transcript_36145/m.26837 type:complete len:112 (+) Transcript_36145:390-725(+)